MLLDSRDLKYKSDSKSAFWQTVSRYDFCSMVNFFLFYFNKMFRHLHVLFCEEKFVRIKSNFFY